VAVHSLAQCPVSDTDTLDLDALGDFPANRLTSATLAVGARGKSLTFPLQTRALAARAGDSTTNPFIGYSERQGDRVDTLLLPRAQACEVFRPGPTDSYPGPGGGQAIGYDAVSGLVLIAGGNDPTSAAIVGALTFDTRTGDVHIVDPAARAVLSEPRAFATVTGFGGKLLVAGGENPVHSGSEEARTLRDRAEVYDPASGRFEPVLISLVEARSRHAAIALDSGEAVLVGGRGTVGDALRIIEVVSPETRAAHALEPLLIGRIAPTVLRLSDGRILVAGGYDADGHAIGELECFAPDFGQRDASFSASALPRRFDRAFVALPGAGFLALGGCEDRAPAPGEDCSAVCVRGCPPPTYDAYWISSDGAVTALDFSIPAPAPILLPGSDGRPWLIASESDVSGAAAPTNYALYRFDPWLASFARESADLGLSGKSQAPRFVPTGTDAFLWLDEPDAASVLTSARFGARGPFARDVGLVLATDALTPGRPAHMAPDRPPERALTYTGALHIEAGAAACVWITDTTYADFSLDLSNSGEPPRLRLGPDEIGGDTCAWPAADEDAGTGQTLHLSRTGSSVTLTRGGQTRMCTVSSARVSIGVCAPLSAQSVVHGLSIER
jgi:hypothetical protein